MLEVVLKKAEMTTSSMLKSNNSSTSLTAGTTPAVHSFDPIIDENSKILILGSFPSIKSFENNFYYAHPRNQFWPILSAIFKKPANSLEERLELLRTSNIALWDVIESCERKNSADSNLKKSKPNDIESLLKNFPNIEAILFTGRKAEQLFKKHFSKSIELPTSLLPSPSPAYAALSFEVKLKRWNDILTNYLSI